MTARIVKEQGSRVTIQVEVTLGASMLETEEGIQEALNEAGVLATRKALERFDTDGSPIQLGGVRLTTKGQEPKAYQTPYGEVTVGRHVYQSSKGGKTYCPLERDARVVVASTPLFAKQVCHKYGQTSGAGVVRDLEENHARHVTQAFVQDLSQAVAAVAQAKEESWTYQVPKLDVPVKTIGIGLDGTCLLFCEGGYRQAMVGTISLYDRGGERQHTIYIGASPEYGKSRFLARMHREVERIKEQYPRAYRMGLADGASDNWTFLERHTDAQVVDYWHATQYLADASRAAHPRDAEAREEWFEQRCHDLKHKQGAAARQLWEMKELSQAQLSKSRRASLNRAITYFENHKHQMQYWKHVPPNRPIGSGVTEAACKVLVKQRLCGSGMKWKEAGARIVLSLRSLTITPDRWRQFWQKIDQYGFAMAT